MIANFFHAEVVAGLDSQDFESETDIRNYNAALHFIPEAIKIQNRYEKRVLLPLAEYLPFDFLRPLVKHYGIIDFFTHGKEAKVFHGKIPFSISICYEETFSDLIREGRLKGSELFVNVTNDSWYPDSKLPIQHFTHGRLRAVENGVPLVRSCNSGLTAAVDCFGRIVSAYGNISDRSFEWLSGSLSIPINKDKFKTLYTFWGDSGIIGLSLMSLFIFFRLKKYYQW